MIFIYLFAQDSICHVACAQSARGLPVCDDQWGYVCVLPRERLRQQCRQPALLSALCEDFSRCGSHVHTEGGLISF